MQPQELPMTPFPFWSKEIDEVFQALNSSSSGLSSEEAQAALRRAGPNRIQSEKKVTPLGLFLDQFKSPIVLILIFATLISAFLQDWADAVIILLIVLGSALLQLFIRSTTPTTPPKNCGNRFPSRPMCCGMANPFPSRPKKWYLAT